MTESRSNNGNRAHEATQTDPTPKVVGKSAAYHAPGETAELLRADAGDVKATTVMLDRSGADSITADRVTMSNSGARKLDAKSAQLDNSGAVLLNAGNAVFQGGAAILVKAREARIVNSRIVALRTSEKTTIEGDVNTVVYLGPGDGKIHPLFDGKSAAGFGAAFAVALLVFARIVRRLSRRARG